ICGIARWARTQRCAPGSFKSAAEGVRIRAARLLIHPRGSLIYAEGTTGDHARGKTRRKVGEEFAAVVVHPPARANDHLVVEHLRAPGHANTGREPPLSSC